MRLHTGAVLPLTTQGRYRVTTPREDAIQGFRELADFLEQHPEIAKALRGGK